MKEEILKENFPNEFKELIFEGLIVPFKNKKNGNLMGRDRKFKFCYLFNEYNEYDKTVDFKDIKYDDFERCRLNLDSQIENLFNYMKNKGK